MIDTHIHIIPDVDDGSDNIEESLGMLRLAVGQGITGMVATPHSSAYDFRYEDVRRQFAALKAAAAAEKIPVKLGLGAEILCYESDMDEIIRYLRKGIYPTMNGTKYVLSEFFPNASRRAITYCLHRLQEAGYIPVIAHAERYHNFDIETARRLHGEGILIQINVYSVKEEGYDRIRKRVRNLLKNHLADFAGSDAHGMSHRPPAYTPGIEYMYENYDRAYIDGILNENPAILFRM